MTDRPIEPIAIGMLRWALRIVFFPMWVLIRLVEEISGEGRWYRTQKARMTADRAPLSDASYLAALQVKPDDAPGWTAIRQALGQCCGISAESIHPSDQMKDLWRMQLLGPDVAAFVIAYECASGNHVNLTVARAKLDKVVRETLESDFSQFVERVVPLISEHGTRQ